MRPGGKGARPSPMGIRKRLNGWLGSRRGAVTGGWGGKGVAPDVTGDAILLKSTLERSTLVMSTLDKSTLDGSSNWSGGG